MLEPDWRVLLIGGSSGTGKTQLARQLAKHFGVSLVLADDVRMALQLVATAGQHPALHYFLTQKDVWQQSVEALRAGWIGVSEVVSQALVAVIAHHICVEDVGPVIIEGDAVLPSLAAQKHYSWCEARHGEVQALFLYEPHESALLANMHARGRGFDALTEPEQQTLARASWLYGDWLRQQAEDCGVTTLEVRPWKTLETRALTAIGAGGA
jgi:2-phosphoglycerate kinase